MICVKQKTQNNVKCCFFPLGAASLYSMSFKSTEVMSRVVKSNFTKNPSVFHYTVAQHQVGADVPMKQQKPRNFTCNKKRCIIFR